MDWIFSHMDDLDAAVATAMVCNIICTVVTNSVRYFCMFA